MTPRQIIEETIKWLQGVYPENDRWVATLIVDSDVFAEMRGDALRYDDEVHTSRYYDYDRGDEAVDHRVEGAGHE